jgi:sialate O-acetylesterase
MPPRFASRALLCCALFASLAAARLQAAVTVSNLFASNMVFQRGQPIKVFGKASPGESVTVGLAGHSATVTADGAGKWIATLPQLSAGGPHTLTINTLTFTDVLVGDVWFCSGQSNIQIKLNSDADAASEIPNANHPNIRILRIDTQFPTTDTSLPTLVRWSKVTPDTAKNFSAVGYYFGRDLHNNLNVPVGLIDVTRGGTKAEAWTAADTFASHPVGKAMLEYYDNLPSTHPEKQAQDAPGALFPVFVEPLTPFGLKGVLWYQGEHNTGRNIIYHYALSNKIANWRARFQQPDLPWIVVQLPNYGDTATTLKNSDKAKIRAIQAAVADATPNVEYTVNIDLGDSDGNIHPARKQPVGKRAALAALKNVYGQNIAWTGPRATSVSYGANDATISFDLMGGADLSSVTNPNGFLISNNRANGFVRATAQVIGNTVKLTGVSNPVAVRYAWEDMPRVQLFNTASLPVAPFRSDSWHPDSLAPATWSSISSKDPLLNEDNDNYPNYVEFFANTDWKTSTTDPIIWSVTSPFANTTAFRYRRRDNLWPSITYKIQTSPANENTWTDLSYVDYPAVAGTGQGTRYQVDYERYEIHVPGNVKVRLAISLSGQTWYSQGASGGTNQSPTASVSSPANGAAFTVGDTVTVTAAAADSDGSIAHVELYVDGAKYGANDTSSPYSWSVTGLTAGTRSLHVVAQDDSGARTTSSTVNISVNQAVAGPSITSQPASTSVAAGANATLGVTATGSNLTYLWRQDEAPITATNVTGIQSATLAITGATSANAGIYSVVVSDGVNPNVVSDDATLTVTGGGGGGGTTLDFENTGVATNTVNTLALGDFVVKGFNASGTARNLQLPGAANGYASTVVQPLDSAGRITLARADGQAFDLSSFDYAEGIYGTNGDVIVTGAKSDGTSVTTGQLAFTVKTLTTRTVNWTGLTLVTFDWAGAGSTTNAPGAIDNIVIPGATPPPPPPPPAGPYHEAEDYQSLNAEASPWVEVADATASGGAYMVVPEGSGNALTTPPNPGFLDFTFEHPAAGPVYIYLRTYETASSSGGSDSLHIDILGDGVAAHNWSTGFTVNDQWKWWEWTANKPASLPAGAHTLRIHYREDGFRLDRVAISPTPLGAAELP